MEEINMKKAFFILSALVMTVSMAMVSCQKTVPASKKIRVLLSEEPSQQTALMTVLNKWAADTGNTIETLVIPYDDQLSKFPQMIRNRDIPDLVYTTRLSSLYPDEFVDFDSQLDTSIFEPRALDTRRDYTYRRLTSLPLQYTITNVYYNADAFAKAGLEPPTVDKRWTIEQVFVNGKKLQDAGAVKYGVAMDFSRARYDNLMYMNGGSLAEKSGNSWQVTVNSPQNIASLQSFVDANNSGVMPKAIWAGGGNDNPVDYFKNGDAGIFFSGTWNYNAFTTDIKNFKWGVMPSPVGTAGGSAILGGSGLGVPKNAPAGALALEFIKWLYTNPANFQVYLDTDKGMSCLKNSSYKPATAQGVADYGVMQAETGMVTGAFNDDESSDWRKYKDNEYRNALRQAVAGELTAVQALTGFARELSTASNWPMKYPD
jgi:alpha-1,4-digalacturonate transport system substrate-binding protein